MAYSRLKNMIVMVNALAFFVAVVLGTKMKIQILTSHLIEASKRLFGIPDMKLYAIADGIGKICQRFPKKFRSTLQIDDRQMVMNFEAG